MKIHFNKAADGSIEATTYNGVGNIPFSYTDLISSMMKNEPVDFEFWGDFDEEEKQQVLKLKDDINWDTCKLPWHNVT